MEITSKYPVKIFKKVINDKTYYRIGLSKKAQNGNTIYGYVDAQFRKDTDVDDSKKIYITNAWLDFYINKDGKSVLSIFINKFDYVGDVIKDSKATGEELDNTGTIYTDDIEFQDSDLPF